MPLYEYECPRCGEFEIVQRITARALTECPFVSFVLGREKVCGRSVKRLISRTYFVMEPNGVYQPLPGRDANGKTREEKISPREYARRDDALRQRMLNTRDRAKKGGFTPVING